jgi:hypothetical protein
MNRRDVIIIAVLVNAGLLVVLFASALRSGNDHTEISTQKESTVHNAMVVQNDARAPRGDEVDQVLSQFATVNSAPQGLAAAPILQPVTEPALPEMQSLPNFSNELPSLSTTPSSLTAFSSSSTEEKSDVSYK